MAVLTSQRHRLSALLTGYFYALLVRFLSRWPISSMHCLFTFPLTGLPLLHVARLSSLLLTYITTCARAYFSNALLVRSPPHWLLLLHIACPPSSSLTTSSIRCLSAFLLTGLPLLHVARLSSLSLAYIPTWGRAYFSNTLLVRSPRWLHLLRIARFSSFLLTYILTCGRAYFSKALLVHSPHWPIPRTHCLSVLLVAQHVACLALFLLLAYRLYLLLMCAHSYH